MDVGVLVPQIGHNSGPSALRDVAQAAEQLGFASLWTTDHIVMPADYSSRYPFSADSQISVGDDQPYYELFTTLGFLSAVTTTAQLGVAVCIVPYRHPVYLSKLISSLDQLAQGRFTFGVGVGWLEEEFDALGLDFRTRGRLTDETLDFLRRSWSPQQPVSYAGDHIQLAPAHFAPRPYLDRRIPFWVGGDGRQALRRTARHGDAWFPHLFGSSPDVLRDKMAHLSTLWQEEGRSGRPELALFLPIAITDGAGGSAEDGADDAARPWESRKLSGSLDRIRATLLDYKDAGVTHTLLMFGGKVERRIEWMSRLRDEVLPALADG
jgi:probable F420-dependent oxidoreductase